MSSIYPIVSAKSKAINLADVKLSPCVRFFIVLFALIRITMTSHAIINSSVIAAHADQQKVEYLGG